MIQTRSRNRRFFRMMDDRFLRKDGLGPSKGIVAGGLLGAIAWALLAVAIS